MNSIQRCLRNELTHFIVIVTSIFLISQFIHSNIQYHKFTAINDDTNILETASFVSIIKPLFAVPVIKAKGDTLQIQVYSDANFSSQWDITIFTEYDAYPLQINNISMTQPYNWVINVTIPNYVREDLYNLTVVADGIENSMPHAVSVVNTISSKFKFIQITDTHIGSVVGGSTYTEFENVISEINLIHPDFVILTGDCTDKEPTWWSTQEFPAQEQDEKLKERLLQLDVPVYVVNGNHDYSYVGESSIDDFRRIINPLPNFTFEYGDYFFVGLDSGKYISLINSDSVGFELQQLQWLETELNSHMTARQKFVFCHHPPDRVSQYRQEYEEIMRRYNVSLSLHGHIHEDKVYDRNYTEISEDGSIDIHHQPLFVTLRTTLKGTDNGYRLIKVDGSNFVYTYDYDGNGVRDDTSSIPTGKLNLVYQPANNGSASTVIATITNDLNEDFENLFIVFKMPTPRPGFTYIVENGTIEQYIPHQPYDIFYVRTDISAQSRKNVTLKQVVGKYINLTVGWNLVSIPFLDVKTPIKKALAYIDGKYDIVQYYDSKDIKDHWKVYSINKPDYMNDLKFIDNTMGIWLHITSNCTFPIVTSPKDTTIELVKGWNLIGYPSLNNIKVESALVHIPYTKIQAFAKSEKYLLKDLNKDDELQTGYGYWIYMVQPYDWLINW